MEQLTLDIAERRNPFHRQQGAMPTEVESAEAILRGSDPSKPLKVGGAGHRVLATYADGWPMTAYEASLIACGNHHGKRRESRRLYMRGYLELMPFTLPNPAPEGRPHVEAWRITRAGREWLEANPLPQAIAS